MMWFLVKNENGLKELSWFSGKYFPFLVDLVDNPMCDSFQSLADSVWNVNIKLRLPAALILIG